jgi:bifunctional DNA-binding transcriptional regulator/antitoxin component of YhaV-PrlF toxin-antitoxin module
MSKAEELWQKEERLLKDWQEEESFLEEWYGKRGLIKPEREKPVAVRRAYADKPGQPLHYTQVNRGVPSAIRPVNSHRAEQLLKERERRTKKQSPDADTNDLIDADLLRSWDARFAEAHGGSQ